MPENPVVGMVGFLLGHGLNNGAGQRRKTSSIEGTVPFDVATTPQGSVLVSLLGFGAWLLSRFGLKDFWGNPGAYKFASKAVPSGLPNPVHASQPGPAE